MKRNPKSLLAVALLICLVSVLFASGVQGSFGRVKVSELRIVDAAGYEVSTLLYKPDNATASNPAPCILTVEGWFNNKEMQDLYSVEYARRGYVVVAVDMHGHGDSEATDANGLYEDAVGLDAAIRMAAELPYVELNEGGDDEITRLLTVNDIELSPRFVESDDHAVVAMVEQGLGTSLMSEMMLQGFKADIAMVPLDPPADRKLGIGYRDEEHLSLVAKAFKEHIKDWIRRKYGE